MNDLETRLERALTIIADDVDPVATSVVGSDGRRHRPLEGRWGWIAAALVVIVGIGATWVALSRPAQRVHEDQPDVQPSAPLAAVATVPATDVATAPVPVSTASAAAAEFVVPQPSTYAVLSPDLGLSAPARQDPYDRWVSDRSGDSAALWLVRRDADGAPRGGIGSWSEPPSAWTKTYHDAEPVSAPQILADRGARRLGSSIAWREGESVRVVTGVGDVGADELATISAVLFTPESRAMPPDFQLVAVPVEPAVTIYPEGINAVLYTAQAGQRFDARTSAFMTGQPPRAVGRAWVARSLPDAELIVIDLDAQHQVQIRVPDGSGIGVEQVVDGVELVDAATVSVQEAPYMATPADTRHIGGEIAAGRWLFAQWTDERGRSCQSLMTSWAGGANGCGPATANGVACAALFGSAQQPDGRTTHDFVIVVEGASHQIQAVIDRGAPIDPATMEQSNGFVIASGTTPAEPRERAEVYLDGQHANC